MDPKQVPSQPTLFDVRFSPTGLLLGASTQAGAVRTDVTIQQQSMPNQSAAVLEVKQGNQSLVQATVTITSASSIARKVDVVATWTAQGKANHYEINIDGPQAGAQTKSAIHLNYNGATYEGFYNYDSSSIEGYAGAPGLPSVLGDEAKQAATPFLDLLHASILKYQAASGGLFTAPGLTVNVAQPTAGPSGWKGAILCRAACCAAGSLAAGACCAFTVGAACAICAAAAAAAASACSDACK